ncbi:MAG: hypothetical protein IJU33_05140 [Bacteroidales bacterium]|nr:hypothetical protein [Bacteroidales bacterium]
MNDVVEMRDNIDKFTRLKVKHLSGSSKWKPKEFESWKDFWLSNKTEDWPKSGTICDCCREKKETFVGGHVIDDKEKKYIYPVCDSCNSTYGEGKEESPSFYAQKFLLVPFDEKIDAKPKED